LEIKSQVFNVEGTRTGRIPSSTLNTSNTPATMSAEEACVSILIMAIKNEVVCAKDSATRTRMHDALYDWDTARREYEEAANGK